VQLFLFPSPFLTLQRIFLSYNHGKARRKGAWAVKGVKAMPKKETQKKDPSKKDPQKKDLPQKVLPQKNPQKKDRAGRPGGCKAVIDIGSNALRLKIAEARKTSKIKYIESVAYDLSLGRDTFDDGKITFENLEKICAIVKNYMTLAAGYGVSDIRVVATTAVREATNREYILDQIKIKTGLNVEVIDDAQEKLYIYKLMSSLLADSLKESTLLVYIGSGSVGLSYMAQGQVAAAHNIKTGSLRISELFTELQEYSSDFHLVLEEYLNGFTDGLTDIPHTIKDFVASGQEVALIANLCGAADDGLFLHIPKENFIRVYEELKHKSVDNIALDYKLTTEKAEVLLPAMAIFKRLLDLTGADSLLSPAILLSDALLFEMLNPRRFAEINKEFNKYTLLHARGIAARFQVPASHSDAVERYAVKIFDKMKKIHGMAGHEKLLLQTAAILHDIGKFINFKHHYLHACNIVTGLDILGLSNLDREIVACICQYHSARTPTLHDGNYSRLLPAERVLVSKLTAILRAADALDRSGGEKFQDIDVKVEDELVVAISTAQNIDLDQWVFTQKCALFEEVFGIKAKLKNKKVL
jgi:exopolyphosphatase/guanosine-5'-triphosphate,3'-diphosphate pyrophosphatase